MVERRTGLWLHPKKNWIDEGMRDQLKIFLCLSLCAWYAASASICTAYLVYDSWSGLVVPSCNGIYRLGMSSEIWCMRPAVEAFILLLIMTWPISGPSCYYLKQVHPRTFFIVSPSICMEWTPIGRASAAYTNNADAYHKLLKTKLYCHGWTAEPLSML